MDNFYLAARLAAEEAAGRASVGPGLFYRFKVASDVEFVCLDTSKEHFFRRGRLQPVATIAQVELLQRQALGGSPLITGHRPYLADCC